MNIQQMLGSAIAESVDVIGSAFHLFATREPRARRPEILASWHDQFSPASLDQRAARRTAQALFRAATVRN